MAVLEHGLWATGHRTVRTIRSRRGHAVEVLDDGVPLADVDGDGIVRATDGLVLAEAPLFRGAPPTGARGPAAVRATRMRDVVPAVGLTVDVFGVRQGEVHVVAAVEGLRERALEAALLVDGVVVARLRTLGPRAEGAAVRAGGDELARLARFDHLRGVRRTVSSWDLSLAAVEDPRVRVLAVAALLRLPALRTAAAGRERARRRARDGASGRPV